MNRYKLIAISLVTLLFFNCKLTVSVIDLNQNEIVIREARLDKPENVVFWQAGARRIIPLQDIRFIEIFASESKTINEKLFFSVEVELKSGETMGYERRVSGNADMMTYIYAENFITGKTGTGDSFIKIGLNRISKMTVKK